MKLTKAYPARIILSALVILLVSVEVTAQNEVAIGSSTTKSNAILWLNGNGSQGLILPVVTNKSAVSNPDKGMVIYDDADNKVWYRNGSNWVEVGGGSGSATNLNLLLQGNQLQLKDGTSVLSSVNLAAGTQGNGAFMVFQGGAWQYATLSGDVTGLNGALQVAGMKGKTMASLPASTQVLAYDPAANSGNGGWVFQSPTVGGSVTSVTGTAPVTVTNGTTTPAIAIATGGITNALLANNAVTSAKIQDGTITDTDIAGAAAIAVSKLANGADGQVLTTVAGTPSWASGPTGTVTSVTAGTGLTGGPITTTGALSVDVGTTANKIVQLDGTGRLPAVDGSQLTNIPVGTVADGSITGGPAGAGVKIAAGTITNANISASANIAATKLANTVVLDTEVPNAAGDINGDFSSGLQIKAGTIVDADISVAAAIAVSKLANGADGQVLTTVAGTPSWASGPTGTVTSVTAGTGLTGGPITTTGALSVDVGTTANKIVQLDGTGRLPAIDGSQLTNLAVSVVADGSITGGPAGAGVKIAAGTITNANISASANIAATKLANTVVLDTEVPNAAGDISGDFSSGLQIKAGTIVNADISGTAAIAGTKVAPSFGAQNISTTGSLNTGAITTTNLASINAVTYAWPGAQGAPGTVLTNGGTGTLTWALGSTGTVTSVTAGTGLTGGPIITTGALSVDVGTTANKIVQLDGTGRLPAVDGSQLTNLPAGGAWNLSGNTGSTPGTDFIGTTDAQDLVFKTTNTEKLRVTQTGNVGIGTAAPTVRLEVFGGGTGFRHTDGTINVESQLLGADAYFGTASANHNFHLLAGGVDQMIIRADNGRFGIGRNPTDQKFEVGGGMYVNGDLGLGTPTPSARLDVAGTVKIVDGTEAAGRVLTSDASGLASWQPAGAGSGWTLVGNAGTVNATNFIGTTDAVDLTLRVNNLKAGRLSVNDQHGVFFGLQAGELQTEGSALLNTAFGAKALWLNVTGDNNTAVGQGALLANEASNNTAVGQGALGNNNTGIGNTAVGGLSLQNNSTVTARENTAIGFFSLRSNTTGFRNSALGFQADVSAGALSNAAAIGAYAYVEQSNSIVLGGRNGVNGATADTNVGIGTGAPTQRLHVIGNILASGTITPSDVRYKKSIVPLSNALQNVSRLRGVSYYYRTEEFSDLGFNTKKQIGVIAQEIEKVYPELVVTDTKGYKAVDYAKLTPVLVEAIKELNSQNEQLMMKVNALEAENKKLSSENGLLDSKVTSFELQQQSIQKDVEELKKILGMKASTN